MKKRKSENHGLEQVGDILRRILENQLFMLDCGCHVAFRFQRHDVNRKDNCDKEREYFLDKTNG